jgi:ketosteroid isomerase-like protein
MRHPILAAVVVLLMMSSGFARAKEPEHRQHEQLTIKVDRPSPTIDISSYTLITDDAERDRREAAELMRVKADWPRAVQTKDKALFESILARDFTFHGEHQWYGRDAYIQARVESGERVVAVRYENLVLQFFGPVAVLTYRNILNHTDPAGKPDMLSLTWADVWVKENGKWKVGTTHLITERVEPMVGDR